MAKLTHKARCPFHSFLRPLSCTGPLYKPPLTPRPTHSIANKMVVLSHQPFPDSFAQFRTCKTTLNTPAKIPVVDMADAANAARLVVEACRDLGFFKLINHNIPMELLASLEDNALNFFKQPQAHKDKSGPPNPFGYGNKRIGVNGDVGWVEYLLFCTNPEIIAGDPRTSIPGLPQTLRDLVNEYVAGVRSLACVVLEMIAGELGFNRTAFSRLVRDVNSDSCFRLNHYPPCPDPEPRNLVGFGEHTDPQLISVLRSNTISGLQIYLRDGSWLSVPPDHTSLFVNVGDCLQVMTNGRLRSVKHRVVAGSLRSRVSMIYFGGPPLSEKIAPLIEQGEESLYREFTWCEYKKSAYKTRLADNRLLPFEK